MTDTSYEGWKNRQTWSVALTLNNDRELYFKMIQYLKKANHPTYKGLITYLGLRGSRTPENIKWTGKNLDVMALDNMLLQFKKELAE